MTLDLSVLTRRDNTVTVAAPICLIVQQELPDDYSAFELT